MKINMCKWQIFFRRINYQIGFFPIKYLGVPVSPRKLHVKDWNPNVEKNEKKFVIWSGGIMSIAQNHIDKL